MIGGLFQDIWYLWRHIQNKDYRNTWMIQYFSASFIGGILGAIVYVIIIAGLIILDTDTDEGKPRDFVVMSLAAWSTAMGVPTAIISVITGILGWRIGKRKKITYDY